MITNCNRCNKQQELSNSIITENQILCKECNFIVNPPRVFLIKKWEGTMLFALAENKYVLRNTSELYKDCNLEVFQHSTFLSKLKSPAFMETFVLRYRGKHRCKLVYNYNWPDNFVPCRNEYCIT